MSALTPERVEALRAAGAFLRTLLIRMSILAAGAGFIVGLLVGHLAW